MTHPLIHHLERTAVALRGLCRGLGLPVALDLSDDERADRAARESASGIVDKLIDKGAAAGLRVVDEIRRQVLALVKAHGDDPAAVIEEARRVLASFEPLLARVMSDTLLAAWLAGGDSLLDQLPPLAESDGGIGSILPPPPPRLFAGDDGPLVRFPITEAAARDLWDRQLLTKPDFDRLAADAKAAAFTVARVGTEDALSRLRTALATDVGQGGTLREFRKSVADALGESALSPGHVENVYRANVAAAYAAGLAETLEQPLVADEFPYVEYHAVHDDRVDPEHLAMESLGIQGSNVYRRDDPIWEKFWPPWRWNCRCMVIPITLEDAALRGIREAIDWLATGLPPARKAWVAPPPFNPPPGWTTRRRLTAVV